MEIVTTDRTARRTYARQQFDELRRMGFSRGVASEIMQAARPSMAIRAAEWAFSLFPFIREVVENRNATAMAMGEYEPVKFFQQNVDDDTSCVVTIHPKGLATHDEVIAEALLYFGDLIQLTHLRVTVDSKRKEYEKRYPGSTGTWPSNNPQGLEQLAQGALEAFKGLPPQRQ